MSKEVKNYQVAICELDGCGKPVGTHYVHATVGTIEQAKEKARELHVFSVMATPAMTEIEVVEYDERAG